MAGEKSGTCTQPRGDKGWILHCGFIDGIPRCEGRAAKPEAAEVYYQEIAYHRAINKRHSQFKYDGAFHLIWYHVTIVYRLLLPESVDTTVVMYVFRKRNIGHELT